MSLLVQHIGKSFQSKQVLADISLEVKKGEFVSLLGPSGSGKSTLFAIIGGMLQPDAGEVVMDGRSITNQSGHISYMPQQDSLFPWRTILDNVLLGQELQGDVDREYAKEMLRIAGLEDVIHAYPHELSGGMKQRASFIRALLSPQDLLCLDEPFSALDEFTRLDMQKWLLATWNQYRQSILFITHNIEEALFLSDKIVILTNSPTTVKEIITVPFPRPREESLLLTNEFLSWKRKVLASMQAPM